MTILLFRLFIILLDFIISFGIRVWTWRDLITSLQSQLRVLRGYFVFAVYLDLLVFILCVKYVPGFSDYVGTILRYWFLSSWVNHVSISPFGKSSHIRGRPSWEDNVLKSVSITGLILRNRGRSFVGYLLRFSRVITTLNSSRVKLTCLLAFHMYDILRAQGATGLILRLKTYSVLLQQAVGRHIVLDTMPLGARVGRSRKGLPRIIPKFERTKILKGDKECIRWWLSMFLIYRFIDGRHRAPTFSTITNPCTAKISVFTGVPLTFWTTLLRTGWVSSIGRHTTIIGKDFPHSRDIGLMKASILGYFRGTKEIGFPNLSHDPWDMRRAKERKPESPLGDVSDGVLFLTSRWDAAKKGPKKGAPLEGLAMVSPSSLMDPIAGIRPNWEYLLDRRFYYMMARILANQWEEPKGVFLRWLSGFFKQSPVLPEAYVIGKPVHIGRAYTGVFESLRLSFTPLVRSSPTSHKIEEDQKTTSMSLSSVITSLFTIKEYSKNFLFRSIPSSWWLDIPREYDHGDSRAAISLVRWLACLNFSLFSPRLMAFSAYHGRLRHLLDVPTGPVAESIGKLGLKLEPAGKVRVFAMVDPITQWALQPLHKLIFAILERIPQDGTFDQYAPIHLLKKACPNPRHVFYSYDLSSATDRLPIKLQVELLRPLIGDVAAELWRSILVDRRYIVRWRSKEGYISPEGKANRRVVRYAAGQPMGALSSWAMLALTHHAIVQQAFTLAYPSTFPHWFEWYAVLGDDVVIGDKKVAEKYSFLMEQYGVGINPYKSLQGTCMEFAKKFFAARDDCSPISFKDWWVSQSSLVGAVNFINKWHPRLSSYLFSSGWGYKAVGRLYQPYYGKGRISTRSRNFLLALTSPSEGKYSMALESWVTSPRFLSPGLLAPQFLDRAVRDEMQRLRDLFDRTKARLEKYLLAYYGGIGDPEDSTSESLLQAFGDPSDSLKGLPRYVAHGLNFLIYHPIAQTLYTELQELVESSKKLQSKIESQNPIQDPSDLLEIQKLEQRLYSLLDPSQFQVLKVDNRPPKARYLTSLRRWIANYGYRNFQIFVSGRPRNKGRGVKK